jgi:drug/metabolite transporter (DMT)-like permease
MLVVYVIRRWTATAASYQFVLFPIVSVIGGALLLDESITASLLLGAPLVLAGVYLGALAAARPRAPAPMEEMPVVET